MGKIIKYGIVLFLGYLAYTEGPALVERVTELGSGLGRKSSSVDQGGCIGSAENASESFSRGLRQFSEPPIDLNAWELFLEDIKEKQYNAEATCSCARSSCGKASEALAELATLVADFDNSLRGNGIPLNPARQQDTIDRFLKRARELDRQGD
ncbi:MAG: hypothetical protein AAF657_01725 [Acidobacteriota bacterium]